MFSLAVLIGRGLDHIDYLFDNLSLVFYPSLLCLFFIQFSECMAFNAALLKRTISSVGRAPDS